MTTQDGTEREGLDTAAGPMKTGDLSDAKRWADVPVAVRSVLANLPADPSDFLTERDKADLQDALDRIAATRRRAWAEGQHLPVGY